MREGLVILCSTVGAFIASQLGGWDLALRTMIVFMAIDYVTGLIVAGVFQKSKKSNNGTLNSHIGFKGIIKKCMMLLMVLMAYQLDNIIGWDFIRYGVIIAFVTNELISILENACLMGVPIPNVLQQAIGLLKKKGGEDDDETDNKSKS